MLEIVAGGRALRLKIPSNLGIHDVISVQNVDKALNPKDNAFGRNPDTVEQRIISHRDTQHCGRRYRVRLKNRWADEDRWIYPEKDFENLPKSLCEEYDKSILHTAEAMTIELEDKTAYPTKHPNPGQQLERPILYLSWATLPYETRYEASELEMTCLAWAVGHLRQYLEGSPFKVITDHSAIPGILRSSANTSYSLLLDKFRMQLMPFIDHMDIVHRPGKSIPQVDCLSRNIGLGTSERDSAGGTMGNAPTAQETVDGSRGKEEVAQQPREDGSGAG